MSKPFRRRQILVDRRLQMRLTGWLTLITLCALVFQAGLFISNMAELATSAPADPQQAMEAAVATGTRTLIVSLMVVLPLMIIVGTLTMFRIAGPLFRIQRFLTEVAEGGSPPDCTLRAKDELGDLCTLVNRATAEQRARNGSASHDVKRAA